MGRPGPEDDWHEWYFGRHEIECQWCCAKLIDQECSLGVSGDGEVFRCPACGGEWFERFTDEEAT